MEKSRDRYFDALYEVARTVNSTLNTDEVLSRIVRAATEAADAKGCSVLLFDDEKKHLIHSADYGLSEQYLRKGEIVAYCSLPDAPKGEAVVVSDVTNDPRIQYPAEAVKEGIGSILCVPLSVRNIAIGEMRIYASQKQVFPKDTVKLLTAIASISAIAVENSNIHDSLKKAYEVCQRELWHWQP